MNDNKRETKTKSLVAVGNRTVEPLFGVSGSVVQSDKFWRWGDDNMMPYALSLMSRRSTTHRRIINDKADYIAGKGFSFDESEPLL
ncbi:MAG: phage portal protein, partial [Alistipes sp.]|nr:phage portal protein [Alistipes sp.]